MSLRIVPVKSRKDLRQFILLPARIHKDHQNWIPPVYIHEWKYFRHSGINDFPGSEAILFLAIKDSRPAGRIMGIINHEYNKEKNEPDARFCCLEAYEDYAVVKALLNAVRQWAAKKGMKNLVGPLGFSNKDSQGMLIEGFNEPAVITTNANFPYLVEFLEKEGFSKKADLVVYKLNIPDKIPDFYRKIFNRAIRINPGLNLIDLKTKKQLKKYIKPIFHLVNETFKDIYAFSEITERQIKKYSRRYLMILDPRFIKIIENEKKELVAFILGIPDISEGIKKCKGYVFPLGFVSVFRSQRKTRQLNLFIGAIREDYRNRGLDACLGIQILEEAHKADLEYIDSHLEHETNYKMRAEMEKLGGVVYKRYRIFTGPI